MFTQTKFWRERALFSLEQAVPQVLDGKLRILMTTKFLRVEYIDMFIQKGKNQPFLKKKRYEDKPELQDVSHAWTQKTYSQQFSKTSNVPSGTLDTDQPRTWKYDSSKTDGV